MKQTDKLLDYMQRYSTITTMQAFMDLGCTRLASRIHDLRRAGYAIDAKTVTGINRFGEKVSYKSYSLREAENE